jgi:hypothetical protein
MIEKILLITWLSTTAVSVGTTEHLLSKYPHMYREANPIMQKSSLRITVNVAIPVAIIINRKKIPKKERMIIYASAAAIRTVDMVNNLKRLKDKK